MRKLYNIDTVTYPEQKIRINESGCTEYALAALEWLIEMRMIDPMDYNCAVIHYDSTIGIQDGKYPLMFYGNDVPTVYVTGVTAGYRGEGPRGTIEAMRKMGFHVSEYAEEAIMKNRPQTFLRFYK